MDLNEFMNVNEYHVMSVVSRLIDRKAYLVCNSMLCQRWLLNNTCTILQRRSYCTGKILVNHI